MQPSQQKEVWNLTNHSFPNPKPENEEDVAGWDLR
jgi:hypothetical protein